MKDLKNILNHSEELNNDELLKYVLGKSSDDERHAVEKQMLDDFFINDAVEGLQNFQSPTQVSEYVNQLNKHLQKHTLQKTKRKKKQKLFEQNWMILAILAILLLCVVGYFLIHFYSKRQ